VAAATTEAPAQPPPPTEIARSEPILPLPVEPWQDEPRVALGERLFHDTRLSGSGRLSCASCHDLSTNGASRGPLDRGDRGELLAFNTPTVFNAALSFRLGWEGRFRDLADHVGALIESPRIMNAPLALVVERLGADAELAAAFRDAYGRPLDADAILDALASFERSLVTPDARFDRWLAGDEDAITETELEGYRLFEATGCVSCHQGVSVGGNLFQRQGVFRPLIPPPPEVVRVPSLRNVATTAPYFHDGSAETLHEAVGRMAMVQLNARLPREDVDRLVAFLGTLTGEFRGTPVRPAP
jgi:cytochrome c peroxidase